MRVASLRRWKRVSLVGTYVSLIVVSGVSLFPFMWMISCSVKLPGEMYVTPPKWIPIHPTFINYVQAWRTGNFGRALENSIMVSLTSTALALILAILAGYGFARFRFRASRWLFLSVVFSQMLPQAIVLIPLYQVLDKFSLLDRWAGLVVAYLVITLPFSVWMMRGFFETIPEELEEAALIDGCSRIGLLFRIVLPLSAPAVAAVAIYTFVVAWQEFTFALTFTNSPSARTLPVEIAYFSGQFRTDWGALMASSVSVVLPVIVVFIFLQRYFIEGLTQGAVKG